MVTKTILKDIETILETNKLSGFRADIGLTVGGPYVQRLEGAFRLYFTVKHVIAFNSATAALHAACVACDIGETLVTPFSFSSSASCVLMAGGNPKFVDINSDTYCLDNDDLTEKISKSTRAIIPVQLFGGCADMDFITGIAKDYGAYVIEDAAQALGTKYKGQFAGTIGDCGIFSFNQSKLISCGEGGMLITNNDEIARKAKLVRNHGEVVEPEEHILGYNYRMTEAEAIIAYYRFQQLDKIIEQRRLNVEYFREKLLKLNVEPMPINKDIEYSWYVYAFKVANARKIASRMTEKGIPLRGGYITQTLNKLPIYNPQSCPNAERIWKDEIIVTDVIGKSKEEIDHFIKILREVMNG
jgi:dTDP-4-amino-4,6-dideoxygalactose transaminase